MACFLLYGWHVLSQSDHCYISKNLYFRFIQLIIYIVFIIDHIYNLVNECKMLIFIYNSDQNIYIYVCVC